MDSGSPHATGASPAGVRRLQPATHDGHRAASIVWTQFLTQSSHTADTEMNAPKGPASFQRLHGFSLTINDSNQPGKLLSLETQIPRIEQIGFGHSSGPVEKQGRYLQAIHLGRFLVSPSPSKSYFSDACCFAGCASILAGCSVFGVFGSAKPASLRIHEGHPRISAFTVSN